jgi:pSer/pThr/pTyr-binding forkhead associated (FHA) protein
MKRKLEDLNDPWCVLDFDTEELELHKDSFTIGRKAGNDKVISINKISAVHCTISREKISKRNYRYYLEDFSSNGTFCNGKKIHNKSVPLNDGDEISLLRTDTKSDKSKSIE